MTVITEECLYMRPHLGYVRKGGIIDFEHVPNVRLDWGRRAGVLYTIPTVSVLCGRQDGKMGCAVARDEGSIQYEQHSVCG
jgi:hypothetical protein